MRTEFRSIDVRALDTPAHFVLDYGVSGETWITGNAL